MDKNEISEGLERFKAGCSVEDVNIVGQRMFDALKDAIELDGVDQDSMVVAAMACVGILVRKRGLLLDMDGKVRDVLGPFSDAYLSEAQRGLDG